MVRCDAVREAQHVMISSVSKPCKVAPVLPSQFAITKVKGSKF